MSHSDHNKTTFLTIKGCLNTHTHSQFDHTHEINIKPDRTELTASFPGLSQLWLIDNFDTEQQSQHTSPCAYQPTSTVVGGNDALTPAKKMPAHI